LHEGYNFVRSISLRENIRNALLWDTVRPIDIPDDIHPKESRILCPFLSISRARKLAKEYSLIMKHPETGKYVELNDSSTAIISSLEHEYEANTSLVEEGSHIILIKKDLVSLKLSIENKEKLEYSTLNTQLSEKEEQPPDSDVGIIGHLGGETADRSLRPNSI